MPPVELSEERIYWAQILYIQAATSEEMNNVIEVSDEEQLGFNAKDSKLSRKVI
jgi:hypothetical protein